jgi:hypothetical protein
VRTFGQCWRIQHPNGDGMSLPWRGGRSRFPQAEVCDLADEVADDPRAAPRSLIACFTVVIAAASSEPEDGYKRLVAGMYQRKHVASYQRVDIPVELVFYQREP